jgi:hypothetical protein
MITGHDDDEPAAIAGRLCQQFPRWWVHWGAWSRRYWAYPLFNAPRGSFFAEQDPGTLAQRMRREELATVRRA